ncbi:hypothetical protein AWENTII_004847 [Aspergillus wentii]
MTLLGGQSTEIMITTVICPPELPIHKSAMHRRCAVVSESPHSTTTVGHWFDLPGGTLVGLKDASGSLEMLAWVTLPAPTHFSCASRPTITVSASITLASSRWPIS